MITDDSQASVPMPANQLSVSKRIVERDARKAPRIVSLQISQQWWMWLGFSCWLLCRSPFYCRQIQGVQLMPSAQRLEPPSGNANQAEKKLRCGVPSYDDDSNSNGDTFEPFALRCVILIREGPCPTWPRIVPRTRVEPSFVRASLKAPGLA